jgi:hypothetical protein
MDHLPAELTGASNTQKQVEMQSMAQKIGRSSILFFIAMSLCSILENRISQFFLRNTFRVQDKVAFAQYTSRIIVGNISG